MDDGGEGDEDGGGGAGVCGAVEKRGERIDGTSFRFLDRIGKELWLHFVSFERKHADKTNRYEFMYICICLI